MRIDEITTLSGELETILLKIRKGAFAGINAKKLEAVIDFLPDWTMEKDKFYSLSGDKRAIEKAGVDITYAGYNGRPEKLFIRDIPGSKMKVEQYKTLDGYEEFLNLHKTLKGMENLSKPKKAYTTNVSEISTDKDGKDLFTFEFHYLVNGHKVTAPDGQTFNITSNTDIGHRGPTIEKFFKWAFENTDMEQDVLGALGMEAHVKASDRPRAAKGGQTIGTCAICAREQVVKGNKMVLHGFKRPGVGFIQGECFGAHKDAYEVSADACKEYIPYLNDILERYKIRLSDLKSGQEFTFIGKRRISFGKQEEYEIGPDHQEYATYLGREIRNCEEQIKYILEDIQTMKTKIANWSKGELRTANVQM